MTEKQKLINFLETQDHFIWSIGIRILDLSPGQAKLKMDLNKSHYNANHFVNGGALYTLADFTGVCAASSYGNAITTITGNANYLKGVGDIKEIYSFGRVQHRDEKIIDIFVELRDKFNKLYMQSFLSFYDLGVKFKTDGL